MPDKDGDDDKKTTKGVVNKKQKQMLNKEEKVTPSGQGLTDYQNIAQRKAVQKQIEDASKQRVTDSSYTTGADGKMKSFSLSDGGSVKDFHANAIKNLSPMAGAKLQMDADGLVPDLGKFMQDVGKGNNITDDEVLKINQNVPGTGAFRLHTHAMEINKELSPLSKKQNTKNSPIKLQKQKQVLNQEYIPEEEYDIARDQGRIRKTKGKSDATTMPVSDEVRKTQKVNKGPSALDRVLKKYGKSVMDVGKKKVDEQLDLTKIAEAFGGYIIEAKSGGKNKKNNVEPELKGVEKIPVTTNEPVRVNDPNFQKLLDRIYGTKTSSQIDAEILRDRTPTDIAARELAQKRETDLPVVKKALQKTAKKAGVPDLFTNKTDKNVDTSQMVTDDEGNIIANPPEPTEKQTDKKRQQVKQSAYSNPKTARKGERIVNQGEFSTRTGVVGRGGVEVTTGKGDGRRAGRTPDERKTGKVSYKTFVNKPEVTGGRDRTTDTMSRVDFQQPPDIVTQSQRAFVEPPPQLPPDKVTQSQTAFVEPPQPKTKKRVKEVKPQKDKVIVKQEPKIETEPQTQTAVGGGGRRGGPRVTTSGGAFSGKEPSLVSKVAKFSKENPATALLSLDALRKFMPSSSPFGVQGGRAGTRSAAR